MAECTIQLSIDEFLKSYKTLLCKYNSYLDNPEVSLDDTNKIKDQIRELIEYYKDILLLEAYQDIEELDTLIASINQKLANGDFVGIQGEPFLYEDFTPQQLESLKVKGDKGDSFKYDDFTPEQLANLKAYQNISQDGTNVGIGTATPVNNLDIHSGNQGVHIGGIPGPYYGSAVGFGQDVGTDNKAMRIAAKYYSHTPNLVIETKDSSYSYGSNPDVGATTGWTEKVRFPSTGGITFNGDTSTANALDDYEEGTFTVILKGTTNPATLVTTTGKYTKIGDLVNITIEFVGADTTGYAGSITIEGLPFSPQSGRKALAIASYNMANFTQHLVGELSTSRISVLDVRSGGSWTPATHNAGSTRYLVATCSYKAS